MITKTAKIFNKAHYLMIIYKQDQIIGEDAVSALTNYEEYNINYIVELKNLSNATENRLVLHFSESECRQMFNCKTDGDISRYFNKKLNMFNGKAILPINKKMHVNDILDYE